ncbi:DUF4391 domain-containing protein [Tichowtungia aerotolerans]|uniref:DUF4391 domain-containing protein n=1 Tax=Tichowtungia aerotolerans TaxID=2697043 RepID=A0A6P1MEN7_9BACT|nr:DUF4391 domain-containing protein [Tichowtungia aerotolerans]QHI70498.1 DUF4391 domain-containing protein [Tichowtungia aerotolerans]
MFAYPQKAAFGKTVPKSLIYSKARPSKKVKSLFVEQVEEIIWAYKLSRETLKLPAKGGYSEIEVFDIRLRADKLDVAVLDSIDKAIPYPIIFRLLSQRQVKNVAAYKRPATDGTKNWVIGGRFETDWLKTPGEDPLPVALNIKALYEQMMLPIIGNSPRKDEPLGEMVQRLNLARKKQNELKKLQSRLKKEKQFNRKVEINAEIRTLSAELEKIS